MTQLETLIQTLCPNGVKFVKLDSIATISIGEFVHKNKQTPDGQYPVYNGGTSNTGFYTEYNQTANKIIVSARGANAGFVNKITVPYWAGNSCYTIDVTDEHTNWEYIYYYLKQIEKQILGQQQLGSIPAVSKKQMQELQIPLPPLAVQSEIVRVLDKFTLHKAELAAELAARLRQYEYYRDKLLTFDDTVKRVKIQDVSTMICSGGTPSASNTSYYNGNIPWLRTQEVDWKDITDTSIKITEFGLKNSSAKWIPENCVIVAMYGATAGKVAINKIPLTTNQACCNIKVDETKMLYRFLFHYLCHSYKIIKGMGQGSQSNINAQMLKSFLIPLPPLSEQERIVSILERFDKLCHDIREGLPAEIELRQKQYEHYRDRLLTFRQLGD